MIVGIPLVSQTAAEIRTVFFDMGNVLVRFSHDVLVRQTARLCGCPPDALRDFLMAGGQLAAFERGDCSEAEFIAALERQFACRLDLHNFRTAFSDIFSPMPGIRDLLDRLRRTPLRLILLSNTSITHLQFIERRFDLLDRMHDRVLSYESRALKPEPAIYAAALQRAGAAAEECFFTDDRAENVHAAAACGIRAVQFTGAAPLADHLRRCGML